MIGKATKGASFGGLLSYVFEKEESQFLGGNLGASSILGMQHEFEAISRENHQVLYPVLHLSLSPNPKDNLTSDQALDFIRDLVERSGYGDCQWVAGRHDDTKTQDGEARPHFHVIINRVQISDSKVVSAWYDWQRHESVLQELRAEYELTPVIDARDAERTAPTTGQIRRLRREQEEFKEGLRDTPPERSVSDKILYAIAQTIKTNHDFTSYVEALEKIGVTVEAKITQSGAVEGLRYCMEGVRFQANKLGHAQKPTIPGLQKQGIEFDLETDALTLARIAYNNKRKDTRPTKEIEKLILSNSNNQSLVINKPIAAPKTKSTSKLSDAVNYPVDLSAEQSDEDKAIATVESSATASDQSSKVEASEILEMTDTASEVDTVLPAVKKERLDEDTAYPIKKVIDTERELDTVSPAAKKERLDEDTAHPIKKVIDTASEVNTVSPAAKKKSLDEDTAYPIKKAMAAALSEWESSPVWQLRSEWERNMIKAAFEELQRTGNARGSIKGTTLKDGRYSVYLVDTSLYIFSESKPTTSYNSQRDSLIDECSLTPAQKQEFLLPGQQLDATPVTQGTRRRAKQEFLPPEQQLDTNQKLRQQADPFSGQVDEQCGELDTSQNLRQQADSDYAQERKTRLHRVSSDDVEQGKTPQKITSSDNVEQGKASQKRTSSDDVEQVKTPQRRTSSDDVERVKTPVQGASSSSAEQVKTPQKATKQLQLPEDVEALRAYLDKFYQQFAAEVREKTGCNQIEDVDVGVACLGIAEGFGTTDIRRILFRSPKGQNFRQRQRPIEEFSEYTKERVAIALTYNQLESDPVQRQRVELVEPLVQELSKTVRNGQQFQGTNYTLKREGDILSVTALDGRGEVLKLNGNWVERAALEEKDVELWQQAKVRWEERQRQEQRNLLKHTQSPSREQKQIELD